jgi:hypothetical protein
VIDMSIPSIIILNAKDATIAGSLTQGGEKRCVACKEFKHITFYDIKCKHCANACN